MTHEELLSIILIAHDESYMFALDNRTKAGQIVCNLASIDKRYVELLSSSHAMYVMLNQFASVSQTLIDCVDAAEPVVKDDVARQLLTSMANTLTELQGAVMLTMRTAQVGAHVVASELATHEYLNRSNES